MEDDLYKILGLNPEDDGSIIKKRYRQLARELHPDATGGNPVKAERFQKVAIAYAVLSNEAKRAEYDRERERAARTPSSTSPFTSLFGEEFEDLIDRINTEGFNAEVLDDFLTFGQKFHRDAPERMRKVAEEKTEAARKSPKVGQLFDFIEDLFGLDNPRPKRKR